MRGGRVGESGDGKARVEAVLFDLDGVLIDSYEAWFHVVDETAREIGTGVITRERFRAGWGQGIAEDLRVFYPGRTRAEVEAAHKRGMRRQAAHIEVNPEARSTLRGLRERGLRTACVTNTQDGLAQAMVETAGLLPFFDAFSASREGLREKPAPDLLLAALDALSLPASAALMVGDSRFDEEAAAAAKVPFLRYDFRSGASLREAVMGRIEPSQ